MTEMWHKDSKWAITVGKTTLAEGGHKPLICCKKKKCNKVKRSKGQCGGMRSAGNAASQLSPVRSWGHAFREGGLRGACPHPICPAAPCCAHARCVSNQRLVSVPEGTQPKAAGASLPELLLHLPRRPSFHLFPLSHDSSYFYIITWSQVFTKILEWNDDFVLFIFPECSIAWKLYKQVHAFGLELHSLNFLCILCVQIRAHARMKTTVS